MKSLPISFVGSVNRITKGIVLLTFLVSGSAFPEGSTTTYQTMPNSSTRDYRAPAYVTEGDLTYHIILCYSNRVL